MPDDKAPETAAQQVRKLIEDHLPYWRKEWEAMDQCQAFLDGDRYEDNKDWWNRDRRMVQIRGEETFDTTRHVTAQATAKPRNLEARPIDAFGDAEQGEVEVELVNEELANPWKGFDRYRYEAIAATRSWRAGAVWLDWEARLGPFGELLFSYQDARRLMWDECYDPHHPCCGWLIREYRIDAEKANKRYGVTWIKPDREAISRDGTLRPGVPLLKGSPDYTRLHEAAYNDGKATIRECWYKSDETKKEDYKFEEWPKGEWYMSCANGCGYRSASQAELQASGKIQGDLPEQMPGCPLCAENGQEGMLERIDGNPTDQQAYAYAHGKRLVVTAPYSPAPDDESLYDGAWPIPKARSFPIYMVPPAYVRPGQPIGTCDVDKMWDQQLASDQLRTLAVQRVFEHRNYWVMPRAGVYDYKGARYEFRDDQFNVMYRDDSLLSKFGPANIQNINGSGLDPGWQVAFQATQQALTQYRGINDQGPVEQRGRDRSGVALQTEFAVGEIPVQDFIKRDNQELSKFCGVLSDYIHATYTPQRLQRLRIDGIDVLIRLWGQDMPNYDFVIENAPDFTGLEKARQEAWDAGVQIAMMSPQLLEAWARFHNVPRSVLRELEKAAAQAPPTALPGAGNGPLGSPAPSSPSPQPAMALPQLQAA